MKKILVKNISVQSISRLLVSVILISSLDSWNQNNTVVGFKFQKECQFLQLLQSSHVQYIQIKNNNSI